MITEEHIKEGLSRAYIMAVCLRAGFNFALREFDYGIDGTFIELADMAGGGKVESGFKIHLWQPATRAPGRYPRPCRAALGVAPTPQTSLDLCALKARYVRLRHSQRQFQ